MPIRKPVVSGSPYQQHCQRWANGCGSGLCQHARHICLARGSLPCDVLFVGEAPGESEDVLGRPFVGPAGKLLDSIVSQALPPEVRRAFTNVVACIPRDEQGGKADEPLPEEMRACQPRLLEFLSIARPRLIVAVGTLARDAFDPKERDHVPLPPLCPVCRAPQYQTPSGTCCSNGHGGCDPFYPAVVDIHHPAYILRANVAQRGLMAQRAAVTVATAWAELSGAG